jgi:hypothetical protein
LYTLNNQSIEGASNIAAHVIANRQGRSREPFRVWSMATRIELAEKDKLEARRLLARERFSPYLQTLAGLEGQRNENYWGEMEVLYDPFYAYEEVLATIADSPGQTNSVLAALERLTARITNGRVSRLSEISDAKRRETRALYARKETSKAALNVAQTSEPKAWDIFISASSADSKQAERLYNLLESNYKVFYAPKNISAGEQWEKALEDALERSRTILVLLSQESVRSELMNAEIQAARNRYERDPSFRIIPVRLDDTTAVLTDSYLTRFNSLTAKGGDVQDVAAQIRKTLDISSSDDNERDRSVRLNAELNAALEERLRLNAELSATHAQLEATRARSDTEIGAALEEKARLKAGLDAALKENRRVNRTARILLIALLALAVLLSSVVTLTFAFRNELNTAAQQLKTVTQQLNTVTQQLKTVTQQLNESVAGPKLGMTKEQVEKALGPALAQDRDPDGHLVLTYKHPTLGSMYVIIDSSSGKVVRVQSDPPR